MMVAKGSGCSLKTGNATSNFWIVGPGLTVGMEVILVGEDDPGLKWEGKIVSITGNGKAAHVRVKYTGTSREEMDGGDLAEVSVTVGVESYPNDNVVIDGPGP